MGRELQCGFLPVFFYEFRIRNIRQRSGNEVVERESTTFRWKFECRIFVPKQQTDEPW